jgi:uncharacterized membrane protein HdeD (DUF308 family)
VIGPFLGGWRWIAGRGVAAVLFGLATLVWPDVTLWALVALWGAYALVDGVTALWAAIGDRYLEHRGWVAVQGAAGVIAGIIAFAWPDITALALLWVIAAWALVIGVTLVATAIEIRKEITGEWMIGLAGVLSIGLSLVLFADPGDGAVAITWAIGWFAFLYGVLLLSVAWAVRRETKGYPSHGTVSGRTPSATTT